MSLISLFSVLNFRFLGVFSICEYLVKTLNHKDKRQQIVTKRGFGKYSGESLLQVGREEEGRGWPCKR